ACLKEGRFRRGKHNKIPGDSRRRAGVSRVARRILKPYNARRERVQKPKNQRHMPGEARHRRKMIKIDWDRLSFCRLYQRVDVGDQTVVRYALVVKWRQHQHASEADLGGMAGPRPPGPYPGGGRVHPPTAARQTRGPLPPHHTTGCSGRPSALYASITPLRSSTEKEVASPVVPRTLRPSQPLLSRKRARLTARLRSGAPFSSIGVAMAAITPDNVLVTDFPRLNGQKS